MNCLGLAWLAACSYNPAAPSTAYFTIGDGVAALSLLLLIPQFVKPLYDFRLSLRRITRPWLYGIATASFSIVLFSAIVPQMPFVGAQLVGWPVFWEFVAGCGFLFCYGVLAYSYLVPVKVRRGSVALFARASAKFLAHASPSDHVDFAGELRANVKRLIRFAHGVDARRFRSSPFYAFTYRHAAEDASYALTLLTILADPAFCRSLIERCPWDVAEILRGLSDQKAGSSLDACKSFVHQLACQAVRSNDSIVMRETDYVGFGTAPVLSTALFGNDFLNRQLKPFSGLRYEESIFSAGYLSRLNFAAEIAVKSVFESGRLHDCANIYILFGHYESLFALERRRRKENEAWRLCYLFGKIVSDIIEICRDHLAGLTPEDRIAYFATNPPSKRDHHLIDAIAKLTVDFLNSIANGFQGIDDPYWSSAHEVWRACFGQLDQTNGMDPLQQRVALGVRDKLANNMAGFYPAISRVCLSMLGPYDNKAGEDAKSSEGIIHRVVYYKLKGLAQLASSKPNQISDYLPPHVTFDAATETLTHSYRLKSGEALTVLSELEFDEPSLLAESLDGYGGSPPTT